MTAEFWLVSGFFLVNGISTFMGYLMLKPEPIQENKVHKSGGARGVMVIIVGNGHGDASSNPGRDW